MYYTSIMKTKTLILPLALMAGLAFSGEYTLMLPDTLEIPVARYRAVRFEVLPDMAEGSALEGRLEVLPDTTEVELILLHVDDYQRWTSGGAGVDTLAFQRRTSGDFSMGVPGLGRYALVISNRGNYRPATVVMEMNLVFAGGGSGDPLPSALKFALLVIALGVAAFALGSVIVRLRRS